MYVYSAKMDKSGMAELVVKKGDECLVKFSGKGKVVAELLASLLSGDIVIAVPVVEAGTAEKKTEKQTTSSVKYVPVYKRPKKQVSTEAKNVVLNAVRTHFADGKLFHVKDVLNVVGDMSYSVVQAALGHLAHEGWLEKVYRERKVYYRYTTKKKLQKVLGGDKT